MISDPDNKIAPSWNVHQLHGGSAVWYHMPLESVSGNILLGTEGMSGTDTQTVFLAGKAEERY